ncbi:phosphatidylglycerol:prolipoprotein diacylglycerol transferase [Dysgonomonadaceae bacterium PH5-43]|nr:phosphatidylglycerol:prolipoprotein diacylglycerol transferase [Dysgonomonadaceae bacterium PH5-43]
MTLSFVTWTANPVAFTIPGIDWEVRWYGILFALGFAIGYFIVERIWKNEKLNPEWFDKLFFYVFVSATLGARLGHCLFYEPAYYLSHPLDILKVWEGGLASHGGTIGIVIGVWLYSKWVTRKSMLWTLDRLVVPVGFAAAMIRLGNLMNHEIYGHVTDAPWAFRYIDNLNLYMKGMEPVFTQPSHPTQLYEALCYILTSCVCMYMYWKRKDYKYSGLIFGVFMIGIFLSRFVIEFFKNNQEAFEEGMLLNMGQLLSIPFVFVGFWFAVKGLREKRK